MSIRDCLLCECGAFVENDFFKDYIETSAGPSTPTIGHGSCGLIFNFMDQGMPKRYSSRKELKTIAAKFASKKSLGAEMLGDFLLDVDRLKSEGNLSDMEILIRAFKISMARKVGED